VFDQSQSNLNSLHVGIALYITYLLTYLLCGFIIMALDYLSSVSHAVTA